MSQYDINKVQNAYKNAALATNNIQHVVMLYNTIIKNLKLAKEAAIKNNIESRFNLLNVAVDIIDGLQSSLDHNNGQEISKILDNFYLGMYIRINQLQIKYKEGEYDQLIKEITLMRDAWIEVEKSSIEEKPIPKIDDAIKNTHINQNNILDNKGNSNFKQFDIDA